MFELPQAPIDAIYSDVMATLAREHLVVSVPTGSGKSTRLPIWASQLGSVLVVQPRRLACLALAQYCAELLGSPLAEQVGYAIRFERCYQDHTPIVFVTPGIALRWLASGELARFAYVMLDEFHERRWDMDLLLAQLQANKLQRLIITSASFDSQRIAEHLQVAALQGSGRQFPVDVYYCAEEVRQMPTIEALADRVEAVSGRLLAAGDGDILVFLPGRKEIQLCQARLSALVRQQQVELLVLYGASSTQQQQIALRPGQQRRIILATNVAETSLTLPNITAVIDSGLERRTHQRNGRTVLSLTAIAADSAEQRRGRAGRLQAGICWRLWGEHAPLQLERPAEILREELTELVLAAAVASTPVADLTFIDPLPTKSLLIATERLQAMGAIDQQGLATAHGKRLFPLPVDSLWAHLLSAMPDVECQTLMADLVAALSQGQRLWQLPSDELALRELKRWQPIACDVWTSIALLRTKAPADVPVAAEPLQQARQLSSQIRQVLELPQLAASSMPEPHVREKLLQSVLTAAPELVYLRRHKRRQAMGNGFAEVQLGRDSRLSEDAEAALVLDEFAVPGRGTRQTLILATCLAPLPFKWLAQAQFGETQPERVLFDGRQVRVEMQRLFVGRVIDRWQQIPEGDLLRWALGCLLLENRWLKGLGARLTDDLQAWYLFQKMGLSEIPRKQIAALTEPDIAVWIIERLEQLGVEQAEDWQLLDANDFAANGIPDWQREQFDQTYPRLVQLSGLQLRAQYEVGKRRVTVEKVAGNRSKDPVRKELPSWTGWRVFFRKASRVVELR